MKSYEWVKTLEGYDLKNTEIKEIVARIYRVKTEWHDRQWIFDPRDKWMFGEACIRKVRKKLKKLNRKTYEEYLNGL